MGEEPNPLRGEGLSRNRPRQDQGRGHAAGELTPSTEIALPSVLHDGGEIAMTRSRYAAHLLIGLRPDVFVADDSHDRFAGRDAVTQASREFDAVLLPPLRNEQILTWAPAIQLRLYEDVIDPRPRRKAFDRAPDKRAVARPEDRRAISCPERVHAITAWRIDTVASIRSLSLNRRWPPFTKRVSPSACEAKTARTGNKSE